MRSTTLLLVAAGILAGCSHAASSVGASPASARSELLAADSSLGRAQPTISLIDKLTNAFSDDVHFFAANQHVHGKAASRTLLATNPANATSTIEWAPRSGGVSADGTNGYTYGFAMQRTADGKALPMYYVAYWLKQRDGWHMLAFKRAGRGNGEAAPRSFPIETPVAERGDSAAVAASLAAAEKAFSDDAGVRGTHEAFHSRASRFAATIGGPAKADFNYGPDEIAAGVGPDTKDLDWSSDEVLVAPSGDLGISMGRIRVKSNPDNPPIVFFTIWRRENGRWAYLVE
jgi:hypothetical protein